MYIQIGEAESEDARKTRQFCSLLCNTLVRLVPSVHNVPHRILNGSVSFKKNDCGKKILSDLYKKRVSPNFGRFVLGLLSIVRLT